MKNKKFMLVIIFTMLALLLVSCQQESPGDDSEEWINPTASVDLNGMNLYWQNDNLQFVADSNAKLSMYVNAEKDENGVLIFDDGQDWLLVMETSLGNFTLFPQQYVQLGGVSYTVFNDAENNSHVLVTVQQTASYQIYDYAFDNDRKAFKLETLYNSEGINFILAENGQQYADELDESPQTKADFLNSIDGEAFQSVAYKAAKALLSADTNELSTCLVDPAEATILTAEIPNVYNDIEYMILIWNPDSIKSEEQINTSYRYLLTGEDSFSYVSMELVKIDGVWKVRSIGIEK